MFKSPHEEYLVISSCPPQKPGAVQSKLTAHHKKMTLHCPSQTKLGLLGRPPELIAAVQPPRHAGHVSRVVPQIDPSVPQQVFTITEKAPSRALGPSP